MITTLREALTRANTVSSIQPPEGTFPQGWQYRDFSGKLTFEVYSDFLKLIGAENLQVLAFSHGIEHGKPWARGQFLVNSEGQRLIQEYLRDKGGH